MNYDIASELSGKYDLFRTIPSATVLLIAASGIILMCSGVLLILLTRKKVGLRFFPVMYGFCAYLLFYIFIGGLLSSLLSLIATENMSRPALAFMRLFLLILTTLSLVLGRFGAMWFIRRLYSEYHDAWGIGAGISLTEGIITGITILFNYSLCVTINTSGLTELANSFGTVEDAAQQMDALQVFFDSPSYFYLLSGLECTMYLIFHTMISALYYAVYHGDMKKGHIGTVLGLQVLLYLPGDFYSSGYVFNRITCFLAEAFVFAAAVFFSLRVHNTFYKNISPKTPKKGSRRSLGPAPVKKMPDFNQGINKLK